MQIPNDKLADFAEVCGIHAGDGWMSSHNYEVGFGTSGDEAEYFEFVCGLYKKVFDYGHHRILKRNRAKVIELRIPSKKIQGKLQAAGFPRGKKLDHLKIPEFVWSDHILLKRFLRGVFDTDGHVYWRKSVNTHYLIIYLSTSSENFAYEVLEAMDKLGFHPSVHRHKYEKTRRDSFRITVHRKTEVLRFIREINFSNSKRIEQIGNHPYCDGGYIDNSIKIGLFL